METDNDDNNNDMTTTINPCETNNNDDTMDDRCCYERRRRPSLRQRTILWRTAVLALTFEFLTCLLRFGAGLESTRDTSSLARYTFGLRIHHGYVGIVLATVAHLVYRDRPAIYLWAFPVGLALIASDLMHHFIVLWAVTGDPHFDWVYPKYRLRGTEP